MTASNFSQSISLVLASEGGFVNSASDPGGATNLGITIATLRAYRGRATSVDDVRALTKTEAGEIYRANYWNAVKADQLPPGVDYCVFDFAVNSGPGTAARFLQRCLRIKDDGQIGPETLKAAYQVRSADLIKSLCDARLKYLQALGTWPTFGRGWSARIVSVSTHALQMAANPIPVVPLDNPRQPDDPGPAKQPDLPLTGVGRLKPASSNWLVRLIAAIVAAIFPKT